MHNAIMRRGSRTESCDSRNIGSEEATLEPRSLGLGLGLAMTAPPESLSICRIVHHNEVIRK
jgi:hypothetical protein